MIEMRVLQIERSRSTKMKGSRKIRWNMKINKFKKVPNFVAYPNKSTQPRILHIITTRGKVKL